MEINGVEINKPLEELTEEEWLELSELWEEENESFVGHQLNAQKMEQLHQLEELAEMLARNPSFDFIRTPVTDNDRNGTVIVDAHIVTAPIEKKESTILSRMYALADGAGMSAYSGKRIRLSFDVRNLWSEYSTASDNNKKSFP